MNQNFPVSADFTFAEEGGYSADRRDTGNWWHGDFIGSNLGVTPADLAKLYPTRTITASDMMALTPAEALPVYGRYWQAVCGDLLASGVDVSCADFGYNAGEPSAGFVLQTILGFTGGALDGWIGPATAAACNRIDPASLAWRLSGNAAKALQTALGVTADGSVGALTQASLASAGKRLDTKALVLVCALAQGQEAHYRTLAQFDTYGAGWLGRTTRRLALAISLITKGS